MSQPMQIAQLPLHQTTFLFQNVRDRTRSLVFSLTEEDMMLQSMESSSPAKWHLAHTTWFFEEFILKPRVTNYHSPDDRFSFLFNSYYVKSGPRHARDKRGLLSHPNLNAVMSYRAHVNDSINNLLCADRDDIEDIARIVELGCHHEMQHQELLVTDLLHAFSFNPLLPTYRDPEPMPITDEVALTFTNNSGGLLEIGSDDKQFSFDCEQPRHKVYIEAFNIANRAVSNRDWIEFMTDGGYLNPTLWLMDGWERCQKEKWSSPLYWWWQDDQWWTFTLRGPQQINLDAPVVHVSFYEAEAFARWADARLPTEAEWEIASAETPVKGNFLENNNLRPLPNGSFWGDVWEWTQSPFSPYPNFKPAEGAVSEYNGKFMANQFVLRGGSCATPFAQIRPTYRTFFYPHQRWQMLGLRLAKNN